MEGCLDPKKVEKPWFRKSQSCVVQGFGQDDLLRALPALFFRESMISNNADKVRTKL